MDLWNKLFPSKHKGHACTENISPEWQIIPDKKSYCSSTSSSSSSSSSKPLSLIIDGDRIRVLLYRECDRRGRKLLFDSRTVTRTPVKESRTPVIKDPPGLQPYATARSCHKTSSFGLLPQGSFGSSGISHVASSPSVAGAKLSMPAIPPMPLAKCRRSNVVHGGVTYVEIRDGYGYLYLKEASDTKQLGELIFGAVALAYKGPSAKLHLLKEPSGVLFSRTSRAPRSYKSTFTSCDTGIEDSFSSLGSESLGDSLISSKLSLRPSVALEMSGLRPSLSEEDSGFSGPPSPFSSTCGSYLTPSSHPCTPAAGTPSSRNGSGNSLKNSGSFTSLQRRFLRNITTSLDSIGFCSGDEDQTKDDSIGSLYQTRLGLAVIVEANRQDEAARSELTQWLCNHQEIVEELDDLFSAPRLSNPLWLSLVKAETSKEKEHFHNRLTESLSCLLHNYDTKQTNFFVSKLLTGVLTHHLGWVATVAPHMTCSGMKTSEKRSSNANLIHLLSDIQPYNALWSQLCELTGAIGYPPRTTKTVIVGKDEKLLNHILVVLSYIIRCSLVEENEFVFLKDNTIKSTPSMMSSSSTKSVYSSKSSLASEVTILGADSNVNSSETSTRTEDLHRQSSIKHYKRNSNNFSDPTIINVRDAKVSKSTKDTECKWMLFDEEDIVIQKDESIDESCFLTQSKVNESLQNKGQRCSKANDRLEPSFNEGLRLSRTIENLESLQIENRLPSLSVDLLISKDIDNPELIKTEEFNFSTELEILKPGRIKGFRISKTVENLSDLIASDILSCSENSNPSFSRSNSPKKEIDLDVLEPKPICASKSEPLVEYRNELLAQVQQPPIVQNYKEQAAQLSEKLIVQNIPKLIVQTSVPVNETIKKPVTVVGQDIALEVEKGGRVVFTLGDNETIVRSHVTKSKDFTPINTNLSFTQKRSTNKLSELPLVGLTTPTNDFVKLESYQNQICIPTTSKCVTLNIDHPALSTSINSSPKIIKNHRRNRSDPTNGAMFDEMPPYIQRLPNLYEKKENKPTDETKSSADDKITIEAVTIPIIETSGKSRTLKTAESLLGGIMNHYSPVFVLHATTDSQKLHEQLRADLISASNKPVLDKQISEAVAIVAEINTWEIELVSSHSFSMERKVSASSSINYGGSPIMMSPLVSQLADSLVNLINIGTPSHFLIRCLENHLREVYIKSQLLSEHLLEGAQTTLDHNCSAKSYVGGQSLFDLSELTRDLGIDMNDLPLLLSVASTHTPALTQMFGLTLK